MKLNDQLSFVFLCLASGNARVMLKNFMYIVSKQIAGKIIATILLKPNSHFCTSNFLD